MTGDLETAALFHSDTDENITLRKLKLFFLSIKPIWEQPGEFFSCLVLFLLAIFNSHTVKPIQVCFERGNRVVTWVV